MSPPRGGCERVGAAGAYKGLLEVIWVVLLRVGGSELVPEPGCGTKDGWGPQGELVPPSPVSCGEGWGGVGSHTGDGLGVVRGPPHLEIGSLSLRSQAELGRVSGQDPQGWEICSSCSC